MNPNLTEGNIGKLVRHIAIPASIGFFFNTMFNVVDNYWGGKLGTDALAGLSASFPIFFIIIAASSGISSASTALIANSLGKKDKASAMTYYTQANILGVIISVLLLVVGYLSAKPLFTLMGVTTSAMTFGLDYMYVIFIGSTFFILASTLNSYLYAVGNTKVFRNLLIAGTLLNFILDPWFMYGGFGIPSLGIKGIALATILIQVLECIYLVWYLKKSGMVTFDRTLWKIDTSVWKEIFIQATPASINMMSVAIGAFILTYFTANYGTEAVAAYGIAVRIEQIALVPTIGLNIAALSLVGQNNGARNFGRIKETLHVCILYGFYVSLLAILMVYGAGRKLMELFTTDPLVIEHGLIYLRIAIFVFLAYVILFVVGSALQGIKKPTSALVISLLRQIVLPILVFGIIVTIFNLPISALWFGMFAINWSTALISLWYAKRLIHKQELKG